MNELKTITQESGGVQMSVVRDNLIEVIKYLMNQQKILTKIVIHMCCRADHYDDFIRACFNELENLKVPKCKVVDE